MATIFEIKETKMRWMLTGNKRYRKKLILGYKKGQAYQEKTVAKKRGLSRKKLIRNQHAGQIIICDFFK